MQHEPHARRRLQWGSTYVLGYLALPVGAGHSWRHRMLCSRHYCNSALGANPSIAPRADPCLSQGVSGITNTCCAYKWWASRRCHLFVEALGRVFQCVWLCLHPITPYPSPGATKMRLAATEAPLHSAQACMEAQCSCLQTLLADIGCCPWVHSRAHGITGLVVPAGMQPCLAATAFPLRAAALWAHAGQ